MSNNNSTVESLGCVALMGKLVAMIGLALASMGRFVDDIARAASHSVNVVDDIGRSATSVDDFVRSTTILDDISKVSSHSSSAIDDVLRASDDVASVPKPLEALIKHSDIIRENKNRNDSLKIK